jgi:hypothetical protein
MTFDEIMDSYNAAVSAANAANEKRYKEAVKTMVSAQTRSDELYGEADQVLMDLGKERLSQIAQESAQASGKTQQSASNRGLGNTTVVDSLLRGISSDKTRAETQVGESVNTQRSGLKTQQANAQTNLAGLLANLYASKSDNAPDASLYAALAKQASSAQQSSKPIFLGYSKPWSEL